MNLGDFQDRRGNLLRDTIRYKWPIIVLVAILGMVAGVGLAIAKPAKYTASTTLLVNPLVGNPYTPESNSDVLEMLQTEAVAVTAATVLDPVTAQIAGAPTSDKARTQTTVTVPPNTQALQISYTSFNRNLSAEMVNAIAAEYLRSRSEKAQAVIDTRVDNNRRAIHHYQHLFNEAKQDNDSGLQATYKAAIVDAQAALQTTQSLPTDPGRALNTAVPPPPAKKKHVAVFAIGGLIFGTFVGIGIGLWRERHRDLVRNAADLDDYPFDAPVTAIHGHDLDEEALRHLRMRLAPQIRNHGIVALVGLAPGHSLSTGVLLGESLAAGGTSVVLIDGTGTEPGHRDILDFEDKPGLAQALTSGGATPPTAFKVRRNFGYLPAGADAVPASELLVEDRARTVVHGVAERYDLTLVACMPLDQAEGEALAKLTNGIIILVELNRTSHYELGRALKSVTIQGRPLVGVFVLPAGR